MIFDIHLVKDKKIEKFYASAIKEMNEFYKINWNRNMPKVFLIPSRKEYDIFTDKKTEDWEVGSTIGGSYAVYMLNPEVYEKESCHKYSDKEYELLLKHEISHLYTNILYKEYYPVWLLEGIAIYSSGELELKEKVSKFEKFLEYFYQNDSGVYTEAGFAVKILDKEFGRDKLLTLLKALNGIKKEKDFKRIYTDIFGIELEYEWFNERINKYI